MSVVTGAKQGTLRTFLEDAVDAGAEVLVGTRVQKVLVRMPRPARI